MKTHKRISQRIVAKFSAILLVVSSFVLISGSFLPGATQVVADSIQDQINALNAQNDATQSQLSGLQQQATTYQAEIAQLQGQISALQDSINANEAQQASIQQQIVQAEAEIAQEKLVLADDIKTMYVDGTPTTLEVLASSGNLSNFIDKQEYRTAVQDKLQTTLNTIAQLQASLQTQKDKINQLLGEQQNQQSQLVSTQAQQATLLNYNQSQQTSYNAQLQANAAQVAQLEAEQAAENAKLGNGLISTGTCGGGYPAQAVSPVGGYWGCNYPQDNTLDNWGLYNRECVSYTAFKVYQAYGYMPYWGGSGNANEWPGDARAAGIPTGSTPKAQSVAIWNVGPDGHAMWVEAVYPDNSILVSQYNYSYNGTYSEMVVNAQQASTFTYIYFN
jgi:peptidoglycan DL-endopeptidase CwlO